MKVARKDVAAEAKVCAPLRLLSEASLQLSVTEMAKRKHEGIGTTKSLETGVCVSSLSRGEQQSW